MKDTLCVPLGPTPHEVVRSRVFAGYVEVYDGMGTLRVVCLESAWHDYAYEQDDPDEVPTLVENPTPPRPTEPPDTDEDPPLLI